MIKTILFSRIKIIFTAIMLSLLIIPIGHTLVDSTFFFFSTISNLIWIIVIISTPILLLINLFFFRGLDSYIKWRNLFLIFFLFDLTLCISNYVPVLSSLANLGYIHMAPADIIMRTFTMILCFVLIYKWLQGAYPTEMHSTGKVIVTTFATTQIILFSIAAWGNYLALVR